MSLLGRMATYDDLVERHDLSILKEPGDFVLTGGDLKLTRDGDFFWGPDDVYNGLRRLVLAWAYSAPTMQILFGSIQNLRDERPGLTAEMESAHTSANPFVPGRSDEERAEALEAYHMASEALDAGEVGCGVLSGSLMITTQSLLGRFRGDLKLKPAAAEWRDARPAVNGISIGRLVAAASNAFRHADEWAEARAQRRFSDQQRISMDALDAAVPSCGDVYEAHSWERALNAISHGRLEDLGASVLTFAHDVGQRIRDESVI